MEDNMIREYYSDLHSLEECSKSLNNSSDTWEALENAEKLLQKARKNIMKSTYDAPWLDLTSNRTSSSDLDEIDSNIRQRVITKFQEVNKPKLCEERIFFSEDKNVVPSESPKDKNGISGRQMEINKTFQSSVKLVETCRKCSEEKIRDKLNEKYKSEAFNQVKNGKVETKTSTETIDSNSNSTRNRKTQLPVRNIKKCSLISNSCDNFSQKKVKTLKASSVRSESVKQKKYDDILIDVAVQTSFKDQAITETASSSKDREQNQLKEFADEQETRPLKMLNSPKNSEEFSTIMKNDHRIKTRNNEISSVKNVKEKELKESFVKFLCQINDELENPVEILSNSSKNLNAFQNNEISDNISWYDEFRDEWDAEEVDLNPPNLVHLDKILCRIDKNIEKIIKDTDKLENLFTEAKGYNKRDETANKIDNRENINDEPFLLDERSINLHEQVDFTDTLPKNPINLRDNHKNELLYGSERSKTSDDMRFILQPKSRISSYESVSSDVFCQQARFSTPLNNYKKIDEASHHHVNRKNFDINCCDHEKHSITEQKSNVDVNIDIKNDVNVFITRNQLSSSLCKEKNSELTKEKIIDNQKEKNEDSKSTFGEKFNEKSDCSNVSEDNDTRQHDIISHSVEYLSSNAQIDSHHSSISNNRNKNNAMTEVAEKHHQEQSEKSVADDKITKHDNSLEDSVNEKVKRKNTADEENLRINKIEQNNKLTPASSKNDTHNRTSYDISAIYSENFEDSVSELKSILKEHDTDESKSKSFLSEKKIESKNNDNIENISLTHNESEKILSNNIKSTNIDLEINEMSKSISLHVKIDKNSSNKVPKSSLADTSDKSLEENSNDMKDKSFSSTSISRSPSRKSISSFISSGKKLKINKKESSSSEDFSGGEIHVPDSCSYSIGEIKFPKSQLEELTKYNEILFREMLHSSSGSYSFGEIRIPESSKQLKKKNSSQTQSCGEVLDTDIELTSSFESPGEIR